MYGAVDPIYMVMLIQLLGPEYVVWDKDATVHFKRPGRSTLYACLMLEAQEIDAIKVELTQCSSLERTYQVNLIDSEGMIRASITKTIFIRRKEVRQKET